MDMLLHTNQYAVWAADYISKAPEPPAEGVVFAITGPAKSGKSTVLRIQAAYYRQLGRRVFLGQGYPSLPPTASALATPATSAASSSVNDVQPLTLLAALAFELAQNFDFIMIDDAHFVSDFAESAFRLASLGKHVFFAGLSTDNGGNTWPSLSRAIASADYQHHTTTVCAVCHVRNACTSYHIYGMETAYYPLCRACHRQTLAQESPRTSAGPGSPQRKLSGGTRQA